MENIKITERERISKTDKLIENLTTEIEIQKNDFVSKFKQNVDEESTGLFFYHRQIKNLVLSWINRLMGKTRSSKGMPGNLAWVI